MGKKSKQKNLGLIIAGVAIAIFGSKFLNRQAEKFYNGLSYKFSDIKVKFVNLKFRVTGSLGITNKNSFGVNIQGFDGWLRYGSVNGQNIMPIKVTSFQLTANSTSSTQFTAEIPITQLVGNLTTVVKAVIDGNLRKLYLAGSLRTNIVTIPVESEISVLSA